MVNKNISELSKNRKTEEILFDKNKIAQENILLLEGPKENLEILDKIGFTSHIQHNKQKHHVLNSVKQLKKIYNTEVFNGHAIKEICNIYDLQLRKVSEYKGPVNKEIVEKINEFVKNNSEEVSDRNNPDKKIMKTKISLTQSSFYILAPRESFLNVTDKMQACTLFYRESKEGDYYGKALPDENFIEVYSWGTNYSSMRQLRTIFNTYKYPDAYYRETMSFRTGMLLLLFLIVLFTVGGIFSQDPELILTFLFFNMFSITIFLTLNLFNLDTEHFESWNGNVRSTY